MPEWEVLEETLCITLGPMTATITKQGDKTWEWAVVPKVENVNGELPPWQARVAAALAPLAARPTGSSPYTGFTTASGNCSTRERAKQAALGIIAAATYIYETEVGRIPDTSEDPA